MNTDIDKLIPILLNNRDKPFVKRILEKENYPTLKNDDGTYSTHSMAWASADNSNHVYPTVVYDENSKQMSRLSDKDAFNRAMKTNDSIRFDTPEDAEWFSKNYKKYWEASK